MTDDIKTRILQEIRAQDAKPYKGTLRISKIAKALELPSESVAEVVEELIEAGIAYRHPTHTADEFLIKVKD